MKHTMKQGLAAVLAAGLMLSATACGQTAASTASSAASSATAGVYTPGSYSASAFGMLDNVNVTMTFDADSITDVKAEGKETEGIGSKAIEQLPAVILEAQDSSVDAVSGATVTSNAIMTAAASCIAQAKGEAVAETTAANTTADVIVVGAGASGLAAAAGAGEAGGTVIVLEANGRVGGSASLSGGHLTMISEEWNAAMERNDDDLQGYLTLDPADFGDFAADLTTLQEQVKAYLASDETGRFDSYERVMVDHYLAGSGTDLDGVEATLDHALLEKALSAYNEVNTWLMDEGGMELQEGYYKQHANSPVGSGAGMVDALEKLAVDAGAQIVLNTRAVELVVENGKICGVIAENEKGEKVTYTAEKGVVLATGSYSSNREMAAQYQRIGTGLNTENGTSNPETNVGDGIVMAEAVGAELRDMQFMVTMMRGYNNATSTGDWSKLAGAQQLAVNAEAVRYGDESKALNVLNQTGAITYAVGDQTMIDALGKVRDGFVDEMVAAGVCFVGDTLEEVAQQAGLDPATLTATVETFNGYVDAGKDADFGRTQFAGKVENGKYIIAVGQAIYHLTFGGLVTDTEARVLDANSAPISGLYAAGDVTSGIEGAAHESGDCLTAAVYFGKLGGENAYLEK